MMKNTLLKASFVFIFLTMLVSCGGGSSKDSQSANTIISDNGDFTLQLKESSLHPDLNDYFLDMREITGELNQLLKLPKNDVLISFEDCGIKNSFYSSRDSKITMCYELFVEFLNVFQNEEAASKAYLFIFFHELGHALIHELDLPVVGNGESAADGISTIVMVDQEIAEAAILAGYYFVNTGGQTPWTDEHPSNQDRFGDLACWAVGGQPQLIGNEAIAPLAVQLYSSGRDCTTEYKKQEESIDKLLKPYLKVSFD